MALTALTGYQPTGLTLDAAGNLYATTAQGGTGTCTSIGMAGCGTVFKLTHEASGNWVEKVLHNFAEGRDGIEPLGGGILDKSGNLYGTTYHGGTYGGTYDYDGGTVFKVTP